MEIKDLINGTFKDFALYETDEETMYFFIPSSFYFDTDEKAPYEELVFSVTKSFVRDFLEKKYNETVTDSILGGWRNNKWLWEDADEILYNAVKENKLVDISYEN